MAWTDGAGNLWLFGGIGYDTLGTFSYLNDLWKYSGKTGKWTWMSGAKQVNEAGHYGVHGVGAPRNTPGARRSAVTWRDAAGGLWLFGGYGADAKGNLGYLDDLWRYDIRTGQWTWMGGARTTNGAGHYDTGDSGTVAEMPGARALAVAWVGAAGRLWLFGGKGYDASGSLGNLNDLWEYNPESGRWSWVSGASHINATGRYGVRHVARSANSPGARQAALGWTDAAHDFWLFGGIGIDGRGRPGNLNDLWRYSPKTGTWTWTSGAPIANDPGHYGTRNLAAPDNMPGARYLSVAWTDRAGRLWLFGGARARAGGGFNCLSDVWRYDPKTDNWSWVAGPKSTNRSGRYGKRQGTRASTLPGARQAATLWVEADGTRWLFGGYGKDSAGNTGDLNDLWRYRTR